MQILNYILQMSVVECEAGVVSSKSFYYPVI